MPSAEDLNWNEDNVKLLLQNPSELLLDDRWRLWVFKRGGVSAVYDQLLKLDYRRFELPVLERFISDPGLEADEYVKALHMGR